jgi:hypothetical protein
MNADSARPLLAFSAPFDAGNLRVQLAMTVAL